MPDDARPRAAARFPRRLATGRGRSGAPLLRVRQEAGATPGRVGNSRDVPETALKMETPVDI
eukprot:2917280-Heterocapsa_arctica.AAC.1